MADDKIERQIAFIIDQQAKNTVNIARLDEKLNRLEEQVNRLTDNVDRVTAAVGNLTVHVGNLTSHVGDLTGHMVDLKDALLSLTNIVERHDEQIAILVEESKETDARLNAIITILEKRE